MSKEGPGIKGISEAKQVTARLFESIAWDMKHISVTQTRLQRA